MFSLFSLSGRQCISIFVAFLCGIFATCLMKYCPESHKQQISEIHFNSKCQSQPWVDLKKTDSCGIWQQSYIDLHRSILNGSLPPRYLVAVTAEAGLTDRIVGVLTAFMFALLTNRAFQIVSYDTMPRFETAFLAPNINWSRADDPREVIDNLKFTYRGVRGYTGDRSYGPGVNTSLYWPIYLMNDNDRNRFYVEKNISKYPINHTDTQTVFIASNRGRVISMFDNPYHRSALFRMGLRPETTPRCLWNFLFKLKDTVHLAMAEEFKILDAPEVLKIAIHIRVGDHVFDPEKDKHTDLLLYEQYFRCAKEIEAFARVPNQKVIWYVSSDSLRLRTLASMHYPEKVFTQLKQNPIHGDCGNKKASAHRNCTQATQDASIIGSAGHIVAISMCDYIITSAGSGFGSFSSWLRGPWHNVYRIESSRRSCEQDNYNTLESLATAWSGV